MNNYERLEGMVAATFTPMDENWGREFICY